MTQQKVRRENALLLVAFLFSGAAALMYEVIWTRALSLVLGSTVYAMSTMLSTFMAGLAIGSYVGGKVSDRTRRHLFVFGVCELGIGVCGLASIPLIYRLPSAYFAVYRMFHFQPRLFFFFQILLCSAVMLLPTVLMGATFPLVSRKVTANLAEMGRKVGDAYSMNTVGAVLGSLAVGFLLIPTLGIKGASFVAAAINLATGLGVVLLAGGGRSKSLLFFLPLFAASGYWNAHASQESGLLNFYSARRYLGDNLPFASIDSAARRENRELFARDYAEGTVRAFAQRDGTLVLQVGGKLEGTSRIDMANTVLLALLPIASHPAPRDFLTVGLGAGITLGTAKDHLPHVDLVEIHPGVLEAVSRHGRPGLLDGITVIRNDARNYLLTTEKEYDIISSEPSYPSESSVAGLFTQDYYRLAAGRLRKDGIYCQWLPYYVLTNADITMMVKTFASVFPYTYVWKVTSSVDLIMVGSREPFRVSPQEIMARVQGMNRTGFPLDYTLSRTPEQVREIASRPDVPVNTDDLPRLEFATVDNMIHGDLALKEQTLPQQGR